VLNIGEKEEGSKPRGKAICWGLYWPRKTNECILEFRVDILTIKRGNLMKKGYLS
jgi:hypothetical protein